MNEEIQHIAISADFQHKVDLVLQLLPKLGPPIPTGEDWKWTVRDLGEGAALRIGDYIYYVYGDPSRYEDEEGDEWFEHRIIAITGPEIGNFFFFEWETNRGVRLYLTHNKVHIGELKFDAAVPERAEQITFLGERYLFTRKCQAHYFRDGEEEPESLDLAEFESRDGAYLTIQKWPERGREIWIGREIALSEFKILTQPNFKNQ